MQNPDTSHERMKARPDAKDLQDPKEVWKNGETTPTRERKGERSGMLGRVADAGDLGGVEPSPYPIEVQADSVGQQSTSRQTDEEEGAPKVHKNPQR